MFGLFRKKVEINTTQVVDEIEAAVYAHLKPYGFRKHGRTLHRFVSEDISQVVHFQSGMPQDGMGGLMCVNLGIRIPECAERTFYPSKERKKYYHEYECTIRSSLSAVKGKGDRWYNLKKRTDRIISSIISDIDKYVLPAYDVLSNREAILAHRKDYPLLDEMCSDTYLDDCMIYGHLGNLNKAKEMFERHYKIQVDEYNDTLKKGDKTYLKKGERVTYMGQEIIAEKNGFVTIYGASHGYIDTLDKLAKDLGLR